MKQRAALLALVLMILLQQGRAFGQKANFEFIDQKFGDILFALSTYRGIPIVADETVSGTASFQFAGADFDRAFESFLLLNRLYAKKNNSVWTITKISVATNPADKSLSLDALDVTPAQILDRLSRHTGRTILFDLLPASKISLHISAGTVEEITDLVMKPFPSYIVEKNEKSLLVKRSAEQGTSSSISPSRMYIERRGEAYTAEINQAKSSEVIERLCREENIEYSNLVKNDTVLSGIRILEKTFDEAMEVVLEQAGAETFVKGGIRYFLPSASGDAARRARDSSSHWKTFGTRSIRTKEALSLLAARFPSLPLAPLTATNEFLAQVNEKTEAELESYLALIDKTGTSGIITLKYISTADLFKVLPPSIRREDLVDTGTGISFFYSGPGDLKEKFLGELGEIDRPKERIRYDMLIIQYENSTNLSWGIGAEARRMEIGDMTSVSGSFGSLLNLNFDVITLFGYQFSARLNAALEENSAQVFADTTLHGITGETVKFQNTSTYRYRDSNVDPETGKPVYTGVTREIVSGVVLDINGWVSGDGMVTMTVHASVSKRGVDVSGKSGNPPPTSEKIISTRLNTANGEPVILSGLRQNDSSIVEQRLPFLSRIPLIGWLFRSRTKTDERTEMVIYLVPHITNGQDAGDGGNTMTNTAYERLVLPYVKEGNR